MLDAFDQLTLVFFFKKKIVAHFLFESSTPLILVNSQSQPDYVNEAELGTTTTYSDFCSECKICKTRIGERGKKQWDHNELKHGKKIVVWKATIIHNLSQRLKSRCFFYNFFSKTLIFSLWGYHTANWHTIQTTMFFQVLANSDSGIEGDIYKLCKKMRKNMVVHIVL